MRSLTCSHSLFLSLSLTPPALLHLPLPVSSSLSLTHSLIPAATLPRYILSGFHGLSFLRISTIHAIFQLLSLSFSLPRSLTFHSLHSEN